MTLVDLLKELGDDVDLLVRSDQWLEEQRKTTAAQVEDLLQELDKIFKAQRIKRKLQQTNMVAVQSFHKSDGDTSIGIFKLKEAIERLRRKPLSTLDRVNSEAQLANIELDGYDCSIE